MTLPSILTVTPLGTAIGFFPIRDIRFRSMLLVPSFQETRAALPDFTKYFAADAFLTGLATCHDTTRSGEDVDAQTTENSRNFGTTHIHAAARTRHALHVRNGGFVV